MEKHKTAKYESYLPVQAPPVQRLTAGTGAAVGTQGVEPSGWFDDVMKVVTTTGPAVGPILGSLGI